MSSYNEPAAVGSPSGTGAETVAIAAQPAGVNNNGNATDSAGNLRVDFVWGSRPALPNDERADGTPAATVAYGAAQNAQWTTTGTVDSARLNAALGNHSDIEAEWAGFPGYIEAAGNYKVTAASGNGTTVTYTSLNHLAPGDVINVTGLTSSAYNLSAVTVATANKLQFTVTNAANAGEITGQWYGKAESTTAASAADGAGLPYIVVPSVVGKTTALALDALKDAGYEAASITTASAASNVGKTITAAARTAGSAVISITCASHGFVAGNKVTVSDVSGGDGVNGVWTVLAVTNANVFTVTGTATTVQALTSLAGVVSGVAGTIKSQTVAAGTGSVASTATISITPFATAS
jgi:hypothetical protein